MNMKICITSDQLNYREAKLVGTLKPRWDSSLKELLPISKCQVSLIAMFLTPLIIKTNSGLNISFFPMSPPKMKIKMSFPHRMTIFLLKHTHDHVPCFSCLWTCNGGNSNICLPTRGKG